jgi:hypothetical protein
MVIIADRYHGLPGALVAKGSLNLLPLTTRLAAFGLGQ